MSGKTRKKQKAQRRAKRSRSNHAARINAKHALDKAKTDTASAPAHCVIPRAESAVLSELLKPLPANENYDTALIDRKFGQKFSRSASAGSSFSIAAGVAATTMAGIISHLR